MQPGGLDNHINMQEPRTSPIFAESDEPVVKREETKLIERAKKRDPDALRALISGHQDRLFAFLWRVVRNQHDAEELCQEAFLKAFAALDSFDPSFRFSTWLFTIGYRLALNSVRRRRPVAAEIDFDALSAGGESVEERSANTEEAERLKTLVWRAVDELSPPQRATVLLFYREQRNCQDIAAIMEIPVATVKSHLHRARARLREALEPLLAEDDGRILRELAG